MRLHYVFAAALMVLACGAASAQQAPQGQAAQGEMPQNARLEGTVKSVTASNLILTTATGDVDVALTPQTHVTQQRMGTLRELKPGLYLGAANRDGAEPGTGIANEVLMIESESGTEPKGHLPMGPSGLPMTNGHVKSVKPTATGQEVEIDYGEITTRRILITKDTSILRFVVAGVAALKPRITVRMLAALTDGKLSATYIVIYASVVK